MEAFKQIDKITILGRSGCGKSFLGKDIQKAFPRRIIFDITDEYSPNEMTVNNFESFSSLMRSISNDAKFVVIVKFDEHLGEEDIKKIFNAMMKIIYHIGDITIVIEEVQEYSSTHSIPQWFKTLLMRGRHKNIGFITTTQRPGQLHKAILSQSTHVFCGNLIDKNDVSTVSTFLGTDSKEVSSLDNREFIWFCPTRKPMIVKLKT